MRGNGLLNADKWIPEKKPFPRIVPFPKPTKHIRKCKKTKDKIHTLTEHLPGNFSELQINLHYFHTYNYYQKKRNLEIWIF